MSNDPREEKPEFIPLQSLPDNFDREGYEALLRESLRTMIFGGCLPENFWPTKWRGTRE